jgi:hypothetical protein
MTKRNILIVTAILFILSAVLTGCNESILVGDQDENPGTTVTSKKGTLVLKLTDAPFPISFIKEANVIITKIEIRKTNEKDSVPYLTLTEKPDTFNLVNLRNGITKEIVKLDIPAGSFNQVRLYTGDASMVLTNGDKYHLKIPSGPQTGIKIFIDSPVIITGGISSEILLDFDLEKSFNVQGNPETPAGIKGFHFQPVIRAVNNSSAGRLVGIVKNDSLKVMVNAKLWLKKDTILSSTFSNADGTYALIGIPAGTYSAFATKEGYDTVSVSNVKIVAANQTALNFTLKKKK